MCLHGDRVPDERNYLSDDESLFGSPPPSPSMERALSPTLPSEGLDSEQNVGTLALPGSHNPSKLPVDSVVYLLDARHRPLETQSSRVSTPVKATTSSSTSLTPTVTEPGPAPRPSRTTTNGVSKKRKRTKKSSKTTSTTVPGPSIELPSSDAPVPPNFLRNQQALLGIAGLVANINPASLPTHRHKQGDTSRNPIVVEDGAILPLPGRPAIPTPAQLLATLSAQKELFPVLEQLLGILRRGVDPPDQPPLNPSRPPLKRRKLSRVPAGAADWDVPFPFPPGEGPPNYKEGWTNERCERLISDFITLLREGANKAAARSSSKRASSQPAPQSPAQPHPASTRRSLPPTNGSRLSPSSTYVPLPLDVYLRPTIPHSYPTFPSTPTTTQPPELGVDFVDLLTATFGTVVPPHDNDLPDSNAFGVFMDPLPSGFDLDPLLLNLMGTGPSQEGPSGMGSPAPSSEDTSTPALSHSPCPSQSIASGPSPMTPNFGHSFTIYPPSPSGSVVNQQDRMTSFGLAHHPKPQDGLELGMDVDGGFSHVFGMEVNVPCERSVANQPPHLSDFPSVELPTFPGLELLSQGPGAAGRGILPVDTPATNTPLPPSTPSQGASDIPTSQQNTLPPSSNTTLPTFTTASLQRQRPVPKRSAPPIPPSKSKAAATFATVKKRREDAIQQARDLRRQLLVDIGKSKVQLWELTMEQGVLTRMSKDERLSRS